MTATKFKSVIAWIDDQSTGVRVLLFASALALLYMLISSVLLEPQKQRLLQLSDQAASLRSKIDAAKIERQRLEAEDPLRLARQRVEAARQSLEEHRRALESLTRHMVAPSAMPDLLASLTQQVPGLRLVDFKTRSSQQVGGGSNPPTGKVEELTSPIYLHSVEVTVEGNYTCLVNYLKRLEREPYGIYWGGLALDASQHPVLKMTLVLMTLSEEEAWFAL